VNIRIGEHRDLPDLVTIYNHYVRTSHVTFDLEPFTADEREDWFAGFRHAGRQRLLVAETGAGVVGYATSTPIRPKPAYATSVETTVYLDPHSIRRGIGTRLYAALFNTLAAESVHRAYAGIALPNPESIAFHERFGFRHVGTFDEAGWKFGKFWNVGWYERRF
jgi:phosphinothricin acetyltransferase